MNEKIGLAVLLIFATLFKEIVGTIDFVDPPSGSVIANFEGTPNATTITCNITQNGGGPQITTQWNVENFRGSGSNRLAVSDAPELFSVGGDPIPNTNFLFDNELTILDWAAELDEVIVYCGTGLAPQQASFTLRIYRAAKLQDNFLQLVKIEEGSENITVDLRQDPAAFPEPTLFSWNKDGQPLSATELTLTYSSVTYNTVRRADAGNYTVTATNFVLPGSPGTTQVGSDTGSFYLDIIYGPSLAFGPPQHYVLLGDSASLVCGTGLDSNPQATITWTAPNRTMIVDNDRFNLDKGPDIVRLNLSRTLLSDAGIWRCDIRTESDRYIVNDERLIQTNITVIGAPVQHDIELIIIAPPGQPHTLSVKESDATLFQICWESPVQSDSHISYYLLRACNLNSSADSNKVTTTTISNETFYSVTGLLPGTTYELTVVAVSQGGDVVARSQPSDPIVDTTRVTVPELFCNASVSSNGVIIVTWSFIHTGGLPLTNVSVSYDDSIISPIPIPLISVDTTSIIVPDLKTGFEYTFNVTAQNSIGSSSTVCGPITPELVSPGNNPDLIAAIAGGVAGGLVVILLIALLGFGIAAVTLSLRKRGSQIKLEAVYEDPDNLQQYIPKKEDNIELEECPAYVENRKDDIKLEECPAYEQHPVQERLRQ